MKLFSLVFITFAIHTKAICISPIEHMEPPICSNHVVEPIGLKKTYAYAHMLFHTTNHTLNDTQRQCIIQSSSLMSQNINTCIKQLTINPNSFDIQVARGLAQSDNGTWVSACAEDMPCVKFNEFVYNHSFSSLIAECDATEMYNWLLKQTPFIQASWYGVEYCQRIDPVHCMYVEQEPCAEIDHTYPCAISRWVYASNFMLLYILSPEIAARMPGCRI